MFRTILAQFWLYLRLILDPTSPWPRGETIDFQENPAGSRVPALVATMGLGSLSIGSFASYENTSSLVYLPTFCEASGQHDLKRRWDRVERGAADPSTLCVNRRAA